MSRGAWFVMNRIAYACFATRPFTLRHWRLVLGKTLARQSFHVRRKRLWAHGPCREAGIHHVGDAVI